LGNLLVIWYIFHHFGKFCLEKSGNPAASWCKNHGRNGPVWLGSFIIVCQCGNHPVNNGGHFLSAENARLFQNVLEKVSFDFFEIGSLCRRAVWSDWVNCWHLGNCYPSLKFYLHTQSGRWWMLSYDTTQIGSILHVCHVVRHHKMSYDTIFTNIGL
jgi:hypothetical protein